MATAPRWVDPSVFPEIQVPPKPAKAHRYVVYSVNDVYDLSLFPYLKSFIAEHTQHARADEHHITLNGDFLSPSTLALFNKGELMIRAMNELGVTHVCFGNHEFDIEWPDLADRMQKMDAILLNTNMAFQSEDTKGTAACSYPYIRHTLKNGANVLYTGYLTEETYENMKIVLGDKPYPVTMCPAVPKALADERVFMNQGVEAGTGIYPVNEHPYQNMDDIHADKYVASDNAPTNVGILAPDAKIPGSAIARTATRTVHSSSRTDIDVSFALTHQFMPYDRELALKTRFHDIILGGHEHEPFCQTIVRKFLNDAMKFPISSPRAVNAAEEEKETSVADEQYALSLSPYRHGAGNEGANDAGTDAEVMCVGEGVRLVKAGQDALFCIVIIMDFIPKSGSPADNVYNSSATSTNMSLLSPPPRDTSTEEEICDKFQIARSSSFPFSIPVHDIPDSILSHSDTDKTPVLVKDTANWTILHHCQLANVHKLEKYVTPDAKLVELYEEGEEIIRQNGNKVVLTLPEGYALSSRNVRAGPNTMARFLADAVKEATGSAACLLPAGKVRGNKDYDGVIKVVDVMSELPFLDNQCCVVDATLDELECILKYSNQYHFAKGGFLQTDNALEFDVESGRIAKISGKEISETDSRSQIFQVAIPLTQLKGMDNNPYLIKLGFRHNVFALLVDDLHLLQHLVFRTLELWNAKGHGFHPQ